MRRHIPIDPLRNGIRCAAGRGSLQTSGGALFSESAPPHSFHAAGIREAKGREAKSREAYRKSIHSYPSKALRSKVFTPLPSRFTEPIEIVTASSPAS